MRKLLRLAYDPRIEPGTEREGPDGERVRYVEPEKYFPALLAHRMNSGLVFIRASSPGAVPPERLMAVDDAIMRAYREIHGECVLTPRIISALAFARDGGASGRLLLDGLEAARREFYSATTMEDAMDLYGAFRLQILKQGAEGYLTDLQVSVGEVVTDYLLVQRAVAEDIRRAERHRKSGETRGALLAKWDRGTDVHFERAVSYVLRPQRLAEMIPKAHKAKVAEFAVRRRQIFREGVFVHVMGRGARPREEDEVPW